MIKLFFDLNYEVNVGNDLEVGFRVIVVGRLINELGSFGFRGIGSEVRDVMNGCYNDSVYEYMVFWDI